METEIKIRFPGEWERQSGVQMTFPHEESDWRDMLDEVVPCFVEIAGEIAKRELLLIVCRSKETVKKQLGESVNWTNIRLVELQSNDTWARDHAAITIFADGEPCLLDFCFNGWGLKFPANHDNRITRGLVDLNLFSRAANYQNMLHCVLEGGSIESDNAGTILTTEECLLSDNRNEHLAKEELDEYYKVVFGAKRILWLQNGYLAGDDTDSHIDMLARFCSSDTIAFVQCTDPSDEHFEELQLMEEELRNFETAQGEAYNLIPLPMADPVYFEGKRLPATYANFLIINDAVLMPAYNSPKDEIARRQLQHAFPDREIVSINCLPLIKQHGSLHCTTMQFPEGILK
ncbi:MAG: agmatine deiminase family protein [Prevotellaceae bacterium]|nr:agmatine deiminase family protein [Prevotellaceae bacterium]